MARIFVFRIYAVPMHLHVHLLAVLEEPLIGGPSKRKSKKRSRRRSGSLSRVLSVMGKGIRAMARSTTPSKAISLFSFSALYACCFIGRHFDVSAFGGHIKKFFYPTQIVLE